MSSKAKKIEKHIEKTHPMSKEAKKVYESISQSLMLIGQCDCGGPLMICLNDDNPFSYYCVDCGKQGDVRFPCQTHKFHKLNDQKASTPVAVVKEVYKQLMNTDITDEMIASTPIDPGKNC